MDHAEFIPLGQQLFKNPPMPDAHTLYAKPVSGQSHHSRLYDHVNSSFLQRTSRPGPGARSLSSPIWSDAKLNRRASLDGMAYIPSQRVAEALAMAGIGL